MSASNAILSNQFHDLPLVKVVQSSPNQPSMSVSVKPHALHVKVILITCIIGQEEKIT